jgi:hypothetical protein
MATNKMFISVIEKTLEIFKEKEENSDLPKKFSMKAITDEMNMIVKSLKDDKEKKKGTGKKSAYNIFVKEQMAILKETEPELSNSEKMTKIGGLWKEFKEDNPNYAELYEAKLKEANGSSDDDEKKSDDDEVVAKTNKKSSKKKVEKKSDSSDDEDEVVAKTNKKSSKKDTKK